MTLTELRYIVAVARERHFGRAASACFVSQPTLSVAIKKLEEELGVLLFERGAGDVAVTPTGRVVVEQAQRVLEEAARIKEIAQAGRDPLAGQLRVGAIMKLLEVQTGGGPLPDLKGGEDGAALCDNRIDAFVRVIGHPTDAVRLPAAICGARLVPVTGETVDKVIKARPYYAPAQIPGNLYPANPQDTASFGVRAVLMTTAALPAADAYALAKSVFDNFQELRKLHPALEGLSHTAMIKVDGIAPLHEGAARLYREKGWIKQ